MFHLGARELLGPLTRLVAATPDPSGRQRPCREQRQCNPPPAHHIAHRRYLGLSRHSASCGPALGNMTRTWRGTGASHDQPSTTQVPAPRREGARPIRSASQAFLDQQHVEPGHGRAHRPPELGDGPDGLLVDGLRLTPGVAGLAQGSCVLLPRYLRLLQLGLDI
jgi:hypothetical protein